jgi:hypothetical protein
MDFAATCDQVQGRTVLFGGFTQSHVSTLWGDTWEWDGASWLQHAGPGPAPRSRHAMAWDAAGGGVLLFGGGGAAGFLGDTWRFDGVQWQPLQPASQPAPRWGHAMATDDGRQRIVLFGGGDDQTWEWNGSNWLQAQPALRPSVRSRPAMTFDEHGGRVVLFGGRDPLDAPLADTWEWDGAAWTLIPDASTALALPVLVYDGALDRLLLFEGPSTEMRARPPAAAAIASGQGCHGTGSGLVLRGDDPYLGNAACSLELLSPLPGAACLFAVSLSSAQTPLGSGCTVYLSGGETRFGVANAHGVARAALPVPRAPFLRGLTVFAQAGALDPLGPLGGVALSARWTLTVGD